MKIVGYAISHNCICTSDNDLRISVDGRPMSFWLDFLLEPMPDTIKVFWNLQANVAALLSTIKLEQKGGELLWNNGSVYIQPENYTLAYLGNKFFSVRYGKGAGSAYAQFSDMSQYIKEGNGETYKDGIKSCLDKAARAAAAGREVYAALQSVGLSPTALTSPVRCYQKEMLADLDLPTIDHMPDEAAEYAYQCVHGGWLEAYKRGAWELAYDHDISSAYPYQLAQLYDTRRGTWSKSASRVAGAVYGFLKGRVTINSNHISPVMYETADNELYTPSGTWSTYITLQELDYIYKNRLGSFVTHDGWYWVPNGNTQKQPYKAMVESLYSYKEDATGLKRDIIKRIMAGLYGKQLELHGKEFGPLFNPVFGAVIETNTRLEVAGFCRIARVQRASVLHIAVDGVVTDKQVKMAGDGMGSWKFSGQGGCIIVSSGIVGFAGRDANANDFSLDYSKLRSMLEASPAAEAYTMEKDSVCTLGKAVLTGRWQELGLPEKVKRTISVGYENKRHYNELPITGADILGKQYCSQPIDAHFFDMSRILKEGIKA